VHRHWRTVAGEYDPARILVGETFVGRVHELIPYYGTGDELNLAFNIPFLQERFDAFALRGVVAETEALMPDGCTPVWTGSNHDVSRLPTRWAHGNPDATRCALLMLLALRGTAFLYYGDELGMPDTHIPDDRMRDPVSIKLGKILNRDAARTPMPWSAAPGAGFTDAGVEPWLPLGDIDACNVADQRDDPGSTLHLTRDLVALRSELPDLHDGGYEELATEGTLWAWRRGERVLAAVNLGDAPVTLSDLRGTVRVCTNRARDGEVVDGTLTLGPWEGVVVQTA
jgi:alpha-glucosidase